MIGSTIRPGMTHSEATENPVARARGGMASERATRMPGPSIASDAEITQLTADRDDDVRREREADRGDRRGDRDLGEEADQAAHVAEEASGDDARAEDQADELERFGDRRGDAASPLVEAELLLVQQRGQRDEADQRRGEERQAPPDALAGSRSSAPCASSRRTTARSPRWRSPRRWRPSPAAPTGRGPARASRRASTAKTSVGMTKTRNGARQPNA